MTDISVLAKEIDALHLKEKERRVVTVDGRDYLRLTFHPAEGETQERAYLVWAEDWTTYWKRMA